jgi:hypothetical protein
LIGWLKSVLQQDWLKNDAITTHVDVVILPDAQALATKIVVYYSSKMV